MKKFNVAVVGIGVVGAEIVKILRERNFPIREMKILATRARTEKIGDHEYEIKPSKIESFQDANIAFFAGTEGAKGASRQFGWQAVEKGVVVIEFASLLAERREANH